MSKCTTNSVVSVSAEKQAILDKLADLPPEIWLSTDCHTDDQRDHWNDCKQYFGWLRLLLKDYFSGQETQGLDLLPLKDKQFWINHRDTYLKLYDIIQYSWSAIRKTLEKIQDDTISSPGQMLIEILEWKAALMFGECTNHLPHELNRFSLNRFSPRQEYEEYRKRFKKRKSLEKEELWMNPYHFFCLTIAAKEACKDSLLDEKLSVYLKLYAEVESDLYKELHPRRKRRGHQWVNGQKEPLSKELPKDDTG